MPAKVQCPKCGKFYQVPDDALGRSTRCKQCQQAFTMTASTEGGSAPAARATAAPAKTGTRSTQGEPAAPSPPPREAIQPAPGPAPQKIGRFEIRGEPLGEGAFGRVYRAYDPPLDREVALKVAKPGALATAQRVERFLREAKAAAQLRHAHIVPVHDAGKDGDHYYIAYAFIQGRTLEDVIDEAKDTGGLDLKRTAQIVREMAEALAYAHEQGIIHRDVKPANTMVDAKGHVHLMDFGLAHRDDGSEKLTQEGTRMGTPAYMSPEQAEGRTADISGASDQYSLGIVLYEMLTGQTPFSGPPEIQMYHHIQTEPKAPRQLKAHVPLDLETICLKMLAKKPGERYANCQEMAADLRRWQEGEAIRARRIGPVERLVRWCRRNPLAAGLTVAVAASLLLGAVIASVFALAALHEKQRADQTAQVAVAEADRADRKANEAEANARRAAAEKERADRKADEARENARQANLEKERTRRHLYLARINLARDAWRNGQVSVLRDLLEKMRPNAGEEDLRQFEWFYLHRLCQFPSRSFAGHTGKVGSVAFSPDGQRIASAAEDKTAKVWDLAAGQEVLTLQGHTGPVIGVAFSPDGKRLAGASEDMTKVWDLASGQEILTLKKVGFSVAFSPDGKQLAGISANAQTGLLGDDPSFPVEVWDLATGKKALPVLEGHTGWVTSVVFSPDGKRLASAAEDQTVKVWDLATGKATLTFKGHTDKVRKVSFSPDGKRLASAAEDSTVKVWDLAAGKEVLTLLGHSNWVTGVSFSPDGRRLASTSGDRRIKVWDLASGQPVFTFMGHTHGVSSVAFSPDSKRLVSGSFDQTVRVWDLVPAQDVLTLKEHTDKVWSVAFSPDSRRLASASEDKTVKVWDLPTGRKVLSVQPNNSEVTSVAFSPDGRQLADATGDWWVNVRDAATGREVPKVYGALLTWKEGTTLLNHKHTLYSVAFSPDGKRLACAHWDTVKVWDVASAKDVLVSQGHTGWVSSVAYSPDGRRLASASEDKTVKVWDAATGKVVGTLKGHTEPVRSIAFSPDGRRLASASWDETVKVWDMATGQEVLTLKGHSGKVTSVAFGPDGQRLASGSYDKTVKVWDTAAGQEVLTLHGHTDIVTSVAFSPDGRQLASASFDKTVKVWDATPLE